ncbi:MAG TPA: branched-chain amino acid ABC transporter permease [Desulfobacteraceae bacterium]|nr:branched-chain amino acid ABC transporter permease [Desulfobacteraceae bacterium]HPJ67168.1 branched-chain amino acid ABC transporter permease [Desulfobacteraceae bacterium]HPQ29326.1 branched-chain amino acid ABC transporter permease [Desulfobacteraceae bacterium]
MRSGDYHTTYKEEIAILQTSFVKVWVGLFIVALISFVSVADNYFIYIVNLCAIATIGSLGLNILTGLTGQISIGHAAFLAIGAYSSAILVKNGFPLLLSLPISGFIATACGFVVGIPSLRLRGLYLAITTFAFGYIVEHVANMWVSLTNGANGMMVQPASILGVNFDTDRSFFFLVFPITILAVLFGRNMIRSKMGRAWVAIRDRDLAAETMGIGLSRYKLYAFAVSSFYAGIAGALYAHYMQFIGPTHFELYLSVQYLAMIIIGGLGSILGSIFGAVFMTILPELLKYLPDIFRESWPLIIERFADINLMLYGLIIMLFVIIEPKGLYGIWNNTKVYWRMWPYMH